MKEHSKDIIAILIEPFRLFKRKLPLLSYILGRFCIMITMLFLLGFVVFGLMELAPGDIVDQIMMQKRPSM